MVNRVFAWCGCLLIATALSTAAARAQVRKPTEFVQTGRLVPSGIRESSGVAVSRAHPGVLWTHNDSGDGPFVYAVDSTGTLLAKYRVVGARAVDWEDIALGPCLRPGAASCLYVGDIGDNDENRSRVILYEFPEPDPTIQPSGPDSTPIPTAPAHALRIRYVDGPHDAEALAVTPDTTVWIITKGRSGPIVRYVIPRDSLVVDSIAVQPHDTLDIVPMKMIGRWVTGAAVSPDGNHAVVRTYTELYFYRRTATEGWQDDGPACWLELREIQGEGVDFVDDSTFVLTSEAALTGDGSISYVRCPLEPGTGLAPPR